MKRFQEVLTPGLFCIPEGENEFIVYAPLHGLIMSVNASFAAVLSRAVKGDGAALRILGAKAETLRDLCSCPDRASKQLNPTWNQGFKPSSVTLFLTHACTLRCGYCYCAGGNGAGTMPWILVESAVRTAAQNAAAQNSMLNLSFHGGDAGACWDLFRRTVEFARRLCGELGIKAHLSTGTNAYYTPDQADYIAANIDEATVSFDGLPEIHDRFRCAPDGSGSCDKLLECLQRFDQTGFSYSIRMTVLKESVERLPESVDFICRHSKAKLIRAEPLYLRGRALAAHLQSPPPDLFVEKFREARAIAEQHKRALSYSGARIGTIIGTFCSYAHPTFGVTPEGHLTCCYEVLDKSDPLADSFFYGRMDPVTGILAVDQDRIDRIRRMATLRKEQCADCFCVAHCAGDCGAKATGESSATGVPERCIITREITKDQMRDYLRRGMVHLKS